MNKKFWKKYIFLAAGYTTPVFTFVYFILMIIGIINRNKLEAIPNFNGFIFFLAMALFILVGLLFTVVSFISYDVERIKNRLEE